LKAASTLRLPAASTPRSTAFPFALPTVFIDIFTVAGKWMS
jgi:hypothetical protein